MHLLSPSFSYIPSYALLSSLVFILVISIISYPTLLSLLLPSHLFYFVIPYHSTLFLTFHPSHDHPNLTPSYHLSSHPYTSTAQGSQPHTMLPSMGAYNYAFSEEERHKEQPVRPPMNAPNPKGKTFKWVPNRGKVRVHTCVLLYTAPL